jgi:ribokinase
VTGAEGADARRPARAIIESSRVLLVDRWGVPGMIRAAKIARRAGIPVVGDLETFNLPCFAELLALADHLIVSENFARRYTGAGDAAEGARRLWRDDRAAVIVTCGERGCWWLAADNAKPAHFPPFKVKAVDTTGCGDSCEAFEDAAQSRQRPRSSSATRSALYTLRKASMMPALCTLRLRAMTSS